MKYHIFISTAFFGLTILSLTDSLAQLGKTNFSWRQVENNFYENTIRPATFLDSTKVYSHPDTASAVIYTLRINSPLPLINRGTSGESSKLLAWYQINLGPISGYIKTENVATHTFKSFEKGTGNSLDYFIITDYSQKYNPNVNGFTMYKYDEGKKKFVDTLEVNTYARIFKGIDLLEIGLGWKNVNMAIQAKHIGYGSEENVFIIDANDNMSILMSTGNFSDDGEGQSSTVWFPVKFPTGKVLLVEDGDVENIFDFYRGNLRTHSFPKELTIPQNELVVLKEIEAKRILDKNGLPIQNADDSHKSKVVKNITKYFRWDGTRLVQLK